MARTRKFVNEIPGEAVTRIEIRAGSFVTGIKAVVGLAGVGDKIKTVAGCVDGMGPGIVHVRGQTVGPEAEGCLEPVIVGVRSRFELVDVDEIRVWERTTPNALIQVS